MNQDKKIIHSLWMRLSDNLFLNLHELKEVKKFCSKEMKKVKARINKDRINKDRINKDIFLPINANRFISSEF